MGRRTVDITSRKNEKVLHFRKLVASRAYRRVAGEFLCDGEKLLREAVRWGSEIHDVLVCGDLPVDLELPPCARVYSVTREVLEAASPMKSPQPLVFSAALPRTAGPCGLANTLILENMQDPGNVGTILRTANAFSLTGVILAGDSADPWNVRAVRASMGAVFRTSVWELSLAELAALKNVPLYGAVLRRDARDVRELDLSGSAVAIGNESAGLSEELLQFCDGTVVIPMNPACESLNAAAAAAVLAWEMSKGTLAKV